MALHAHHPKSPRSINLSISLSYLIVVFWFQLLWPNPLCSGPVKHPRHRGVLGSYLRESKPTLIRARLLDSFFQLGKGIENPKARCFLRFDSWQSWNQHLLNFFLCRKHRPVEVCEPVRQLKPVYKDLREQPQQTLSTSPHKPYYEKSYKFQGFCWLLW